MSLHSIVNIKCFSFKIMHVAKLSHTALLESTIRIFVETVNKYKERLKNTLDIVIKKGNTKTLN